MKSSDVHITQDGRIFVKGEYRGFTEDEKVYILERDRPREIGEYEHRSEITALVLEWYSGQR